MAGFGNKNPPWQRGGPGNVYRSHSKSLEETTGCLKKTSALGNEQKLLRHCTYSQFIVNKTEHTIISFDSIYDTLLCIMLGGLHHDIGIMNNAFSGGNVFQQGLPLQQQGRLHCLISNLAVYPRLYFFVCILGMGLAGVAPGVSVSQAISYPAPRALQAPVGGSPFGPQQVTRFHYTK